ncbi:CesT family type III secretion system chaperone [Aeromonas salmonicida]|uniref:CesT family type III secretion system chaperone n=1 Tax=Aeromonas salmonicida TaxID=645 RepID=UPI00223F4599|nr:CesT family type III secretion system chaperone [Aeromonas salmonicida]MDF8327540.1 CesT family type III secretion system chaperone [Aeromonas salmonicida]
MNLYTTRLDELATHLGIEPIEQDEAGHACLTLDKLWAIHLAPLDGESMVMFLRAGVLGGEAQARELLQDNLFSPEPDTIRVALGQDNHLILWCQLSLAKAEAPQLQQALQQLVAKAVMLASETGERPRGDSMPSLRV